MYAQNPSTTEIASYLTLSATQITQLQDIQQKARTANQTTMTDIASKQQALQATLLKGGSSASAIGQMLLDIEALRKKITDSQTASNSAALLVLNAIQQTKLKALDDAYKLASAIHEAAMLNLLTPPADAPGPGFGPRGFGGPGGTGAGPQFRGGPRLPLPQK